MGSSHSHSHSHFAHNVNDTQGRHRLWHHQSNPEQSVCWMCSRPVDATVAAYRCRRGKFILHDACFNFPKELENFPHLNHTLRLSNANHLVEGRRCSICYREFDATERTAYNYRCEPCGFYAHPRCGILPQTKMIGLHQHTLRLLEAPRDGRRRRCLNASCQNARRLTGNAWTYRCDQCQEELCLACQLNGGGNAVHHCICCDGNDFENLMHRLGTGIGNFFHSMTCACLGLPRQPPQATAAA